MALVIVGVKPIDLPAFERRRSWKMKRKNLAFSSTEFRSQTLQRWQNKSSKDIKGKWTGRLILSIEASIRRNFGEN